jgi:hypothetical protein
MLEMIQVKPGNGCFAILEIHISIDCFQQTAFAAPCFADEINEFAFVNLQVHIGENKTIRLENIDV